MLSGLLYSPNWTFVDKILRDPQLVDLEYFVGGGPGHDWLAKSVRVEQQKYLGPRAKFEKQFNEEPKTWEVLTDNLYRLTLLAGVERLLTLRQAYGGLKTRFTFGDSNTACLQQIFNQGLFKGYFRGALLNAAQFVTVWAHPLVYSRGTVKENLNILFHFYIIQQIYYYSYLNQIQFINIQSFHINFYYLLFLFFYFTQLIQLSYRSQIYYLYFIDKDNFYFIYLLTIQIYYFVYLLRIQNQKIFLDLIYLYFQELKINIFYFIFDLIHFNLFFK